MDRMENASIVRIFKIQSKLSKKKNKNKLLNNKKKITASMDLKENALIVSKKMMKIKKNMLKKNQQENVIMVQMLNV